MNTNLAMILFIAFVSIGYNVGRLRNHNIAKVCFTVVIAIPFLQMIVNTNGAIVAAGSFIVGLVVSRIQQGDSVPEKVNWWLGFGWLKNRWQAADRAKEEYEEAAYQAEQERQRYEEARKQAEYERQRYEQERRNNSSSSNNGGNQQQYSSSSNSGSYSKRDECLKILGLDPARQWTEKEIKKAYKRMAMKHHPDRGGSQEMFVKVREAYEYLVFQ